MKQSRRNLANAASRAEKRSDGPPKVSKYAAKRGVAYETTLTIDEARAAIAAHFKGDA